MYRRLFVAAIAIVILNGLSSSAISVFHDRAGASVASWCASAVYLAALVRMRRSDWIPLTLVAAISNLIATTGSSADIVPVIKSIAIDLIQAMLIAGAIQRLELHGAWYLSAKKTASIPFIAAVASLVGVLLELFFAASINDASVISSVYTRQATDFMGLLIMIALVQTWTDQDLLQDMDSRRIGEIAMLTAGVAALGSQLFTIQTPYLFILIPIMIFVTYRCGMLASTLSIATLFMIANYVNLGDTSSRLSPYASNRYNILVTHYIFILVAFLSCVPLSILLTRLQQSSSQLRAAGNEAESARREAEIAREKAESANRIKAEFLSAMSHELRTPLTTVLGLVDLLFQEELDERQRFYVSNIRKSGGHLLGIINDILDISKIEDRAVQIELISFDVRSILEEACAGFSVLLSEKGIDFINNVDSDVPQFIIGDPGKIKQILINLVGNAIKFTPQGFVSVSTMCRRQGSSEVSLRFAVRDSGIGVAQARISTIFDAFTQEESSTARQYGGSGLGLAICKRLALAMGGDIGVESTKDVGSFFWFEIPLREALTTPLAYDRLNGATASVRCRIIVAEDNAINRSIIGTVLTGKGHDVTLVANGAEAIDRMEREPFDLVVMDIQMPVMDGVETTRQIRKMRFPQNSIPIIAVTANTDNRDRSRYLSVGMDECLSKPIDWNMLDDAIVRHVSKREQNTAFAYNHSASSSSRRDASASHLLGITSELNSRDDLAIVDANTLRNLREKLGPDIHDLLDQALTHAMALLDNMRAGSLSHEDVLREVHRVKGMAGMLGLTRLQQWSAMVEDHDEMRTPQLTDLLSAVIRDCRMAIARLL